MTVVKKFYPKVRLRELMAAPGGISVTSALSNADANLDAARDGYLEALDAQIAEINAPGLDLAYIYQLANELFGASGLLGLDELSAVARSLCVLLTESAAASAEAIRVHLDAMRALRLPALETDQAARKAILAGLEAVVAKSAKSARRA